MTTPETTPANPRVPDPELTQSLLRAPLRVDAEDGRRFAYKPLAATFVSLFILYHVLGLLQHTTPSGGFGATVSKKIAETLRVGAYMRATSNIQSWSMFAPNPHRSNMFLQVFVELQNGEVHDLQHDMYGRREYPYMFYDRMGKINRRLLEQDRYQRHYAAWVCRDWAMHHGGEMPVRVKYVKMWTKVPHPGKVIASMGFDPMELKLTKEHLPSVECATTVHAQLPDEIRQRHGLPPLPEGSFRDAIIQTWHDKAEQREQDIERRRALLPDDPAAPPGDLASSAGDRASSAGERASPPAAPPSEPATPPGEGGAGAEGGE